MKGQKASPVAVAKPEHPVPPVWQPSKISHQVQGGHASVQLGAAPGARALAVGERPAAGGDVGASGLPVSLAPLAGSAVTGQTVQVDVSDAKSTAAAGISGLAVTLSRSAEGEAGAVRLSVDTSDLDALYGADWASRARLVLLPNCAVTAPQTAGCLKQTPLPSSSYDPATKKITADVTLPARGGTAHTSVQALADTAAADSTTVGLVSGSSGGAGTYSATSLSPSQAWAAGGSSGAFTYGYPIQAPPALAGSAPQVGLSYDSSSVDGKTSSTNAQASWIGDGWDYQPGFVERSFQPCSKDGITDSGDECWAGANLTMSLAGHSGELVPDDPSCQSGASATTEQSNCTWRIKGDDGTKVQFLTGATNGTWNGSYIKVTDTTGTVYFFGLNHLPDTNGNPTTVGPDSGSAWTLPVYSPNSGDPCYDQAKGKGSWCQTAWRWNLDYVVDPHGILTTYSYTPETYSYARGGGQNGGTGTNTSYTRAGVLASIGYGQLLSDQVSANGSYKSAAQILFGVTERCVTSTSACDPANRTAANASNWPDVPLDEQCAQASSCTNYGPTFWTTKWLDTITTQVRVNGVYQTVDSYALNHTFVNVQNPTENTKVPWLASVKRTGQDTQATGGPAPLPPVLFTPMLLRNRVDGSSLVPAPPAYNRPRIQLITTETGGTIGVDYKPAECSRTANTMPTTADSDALSCYNVKWYPPGSMAGASPVDDWFLKYPVRTVTVTPGIAGSIPMTTAYTYGKAAWHRNDSPLTDNQVRTWDQFRGYASVTTVSGNGNDGIQSQVATSYYQGMDGDLLNSGTTRGAWATGPMIGQVTDSDWLSGKPLESDTYNQANGTIVAYTLSTSSGPIVTATHSRGAMPALKARYAATSATSTSKALKADGSSWRTTTSTATTDPAHGNRVTTSLSSADGLPDMCTRTNYAVGSDPQVLGLPAESITLNGANACSAAPTPANTSSWNRTYYDGQAWGQLGKAHNPTSLLTLDHFDSTGAAQFTATTAVFDNYGRPSSVTDPNNTDKAHPNGATVTTSYSAPQAGELPNSTSVTTPAPDGSNDVSTGRTTTTALDSARGMPTVVTDPNGRTTTQAHDALGRLTALWLPGRPTNLSPNQKFAYATPEVVNGNVVPSTATTSTIRSDGSYSITIQIMDGLGRTVQTQSTPASSAYNGRMITDTAYDSQGRVIRSNASWYNNDTAPDTTLYQTTTQQVPAQTHTVYDGLGRPVTSQFIAYGTTQSTTTTAYPGADRTDVTPPTGAWPTSVVTDARGNTMQLWQYRTATATGNPADADVTGYTYTAEGRLATQKDAAGNTWTHSYDLRGRETATADPDTGNSTRTYDAAGRLSTVTDARNQTTDYTYDILGRVTGSYAGTVSTASQLTAFTYDTVLHGQPATSTRYIGGADSGTAYTTSVQAYDTAYHATKTTTTIPGTEVNRGSTPFTYTYQATYDPITGALQSDGRSAVGDIAEETVNYTYDTNGPLTTFGAFGGATYDLSNDYDAYGHNIRSTMNPWGTQVVVTNTYDEPTGRRLQQFVDKQTAGTGSVQQNTYTYNPAGQITAIRSIPDNQPSSTDLQCFSYDYLGRLITAWTDTGALTQTAQPTVGGIGSCTNSTPTSGTTAPALTTVGGPAAYWQDYTYDPQGNRKSLTQHDPGGDTTKNAITSPTFNAAGSVNSGNGNGGPHATTSTATKINGATTAYGTTTYDAAGNTTMQYASNAGMTELSWTAEGKLDTAKMPVQIQGIGGKCLYMHNGSSADGTVPEISACSSTGAQKFATGGNRLRINNKCLAAMGTTTGSAIQLQPCNGTGAQTWTVQQNGTILNVGTNLCLTVPGDVTTSGTATVVATCGTTIPSGQKWTVPDNTTTYIYDASGNQLIRHDPGKTTITLGGDELLYDTTTKTSTGVRYYQIPGGITLVRQGGKSTYQVGDNHGTSTLALDGTTLAETRRLTDPFGNPRGTQPTGWAGDHGYVGGTKDDATGLTNLGAREYQPTTGRFLSPDPLMTPANPQQWNGYAYSNNDPVNLSDPTGMCPRDLCDGYGQNPAPAAPPAPDPGQDPVTVLLNTPALGHSLPSNVYHYITGSGHNYHGSQAYTIGEALQWASESEDGWYFLCNMSGHDYKECRKDPFNGDDHVGEVRTTDLLKAGAIGVGIGIASAVAAVVVIAAVEAGASAATTCAAAAMACATGIIGGIGDAMAGGSQAAEVAAGVSGAGAVAMVLKNFFGRQLGEAVDATVVASAGCLTHNSFPAGTEVLMADGTTKPIQDIQVGDTVMATDPQTGETRPEPVTATITTPDDKEFTTLTLITEADPGTPPIAVTSTQNHPFWDTTTNQWTNAADLKPGEKLHTDDGTTLTITTVTNYRTAPTTAYNLTIADLHTYYVLAGTTPILVHNSGAPCGTHLALGLTKETASGANLAQFAGEQGAVIWKDPQFADLFPNSSWSDTALRSMIDRVVSGGGKISFNLQGVQDVEGVIAGRTAPGLPTSIELQHICGNAGVRAATTFLNGSAPC
ncbi:polymorphic toxin-type HINT domain-containing protein [Kitasatospora cineracea]|uniref:polymorphic toxin-type HINT domain-containing protein n=1 Tax=Kitasatospora cineracea TaxID=88074 RepID=UPI0033CDC1D9